MVDADHVPARTLKLRMAWVRSEPEEPPMAFLMYPNTPKRIAYFVVKCMTKGDKPLYRARAPSSAAMVRVQCSRPRYLPEESSCSLVCEWGVEVGINSHKQRGHATHLCSVQGLQGASLCNTSCHTSQHCEKREGGAVLLPASSVPCTTRHSLTGTKGAQLARTLYPCRDVVIGGGALCKGRHVGGGPIIPPVHRH